MRHIKNILITTCAAATLLALSSCSASSEGPEQALQRSTPTKATESPQRGSQAQSLQNAEANPLPLPVQKYLLTPGKTSTIRAATIALANDCLRQRRIPPIKQATNKESPQPDPDPYEVGRRYGPIIKADISAYGYHLPPEWFGNTAPTPKISAQQEAAMGGPSGCLIASQRELMGSHSLDSPVARQISSKSFVESLEDPKVKAVTADWSACMTQKGYAYKSPLQALSKADLKIPKASTQELLIATADYSCKISTGLISTWQNVEIKIQESEISKHLPELKKADAERAQIMAKAKRIIDQGT